MGEKLTYQVFRTYSPISDGYVDRISMGNEHGHEVFMLIPDDAGPRMRRARRAAAVDAITEAIELGCDPGQVRVPAAQWDAMVAEALKEAVT